MATALGFGSSWSTALSPKSAEKQKLAVDWLFGHNLNIRWFWTGSAKCQHKTWFLPEIAVLNH